jgi:hypothetical protein
MRVPSTCSTVSRLDAIVTVSRSLRAAAERAEHEARHGPDSGFQEGCADGLVEVIDGHRSRDKDRAVLFAVQVVGEVVFALDLADDLFDDVLHGHDPAVLVGDGERTLSPAITSRTPNGRSRTRADLSSGRSVAGRPRSPRSARDAGPPSSWRLRST